MVLTVKKLVILFGKVICHFLKQKLLSFLQLIGLHGMKISHFMQVEMPNLLSDEYNVNDVLYSEYEFVDEYTNSFAVHFKTNWAPNESSYKLFDNFGNILFEKSFSGLEPQTVYKDTFNLDPGCYKLQFLDVGGANDFNEDGINWWGNNDGSSNTNDAGYIRLRSVPGHTLSIMKETLELS